MPLIDALPPGPLDIVGDVHGEHAALEALLDHLGYRADGRHPQGRRLVFVGDLCDRGPDSPAVIDRVRGLVRDGGARAVLGNHELNLLNGQRKDGNDWFWGEGRARDRKYGAVATLPASGRAGVLGFLRGLPLALERPDLRIVHAAWHPASIDALRALPAGTAPDAAFDRWDAEAHARIRERALDAAEAGERARWEPVWSDASRPVPFLPAVAEANLLRQMANPVRVVVAGTERPSDAPFYTSGQWRFVQRMRWWDGYDDAPAVVVGHYWRRLRPAPQPAHASHGTGDADLFDAIGPQAWHGLRGNVFCVDFSVGGRYRDRQGRPAHGPGATPADSHLAALRWPERLLALDDGRVLPTMGYGLPGRA
ncbi:MAG: metallophosphoesterase [Xylophilus ampelinus]